MADLFVLDTSVAARWFFTDEPLRDQALAVRAVVCEEPHRFIVPHLFAAELLHVLARKSGRDLAFTSEALDLVNRLGLRTIALSKGANRRACEWACRGLSGYDATFVGLAEDLGGQWLTADEPAAKRAGHSARRLKSWK